MFKQKLTFLKVFWKSSLTVFLITLGPAKPIRAPGSANKISPTIVNDAETPPVVGFVKKQYKDLTL